MAKTLKISVINKEGESIAEKTAPAEIFGADSNPSLLTQAVRAFLSNQRHARGQVKTRSGVTGSTVKIYKQKGTGRARHGDRQAPIFVGGGVSHGPTGLQNYKKEFNQKMGRKAIFAAFSQMLKAKKLYILADLKVSKTKEASLMMETYKEKFSLGGRIALVCEKDEELKRYFRNIENLTIIDSGSLNAYLLLRQDSVLLTEKAYEEVLKHK